jgi:hypothetical protein
MRTPSVRRGRTAAGALAATAALAGVTAATALAASHNLPAAGKLTTCHTTLFKVGGTLPVHTAFATQSHKHPAKSLLTCANANAVAKAGKRYYHTSPFGLGKKVTVGGVTYTMGKNATGMLGGKPTSGPVYGWSGGGVVIYLLNPSG